MQKLIFPLLIGFAFAACTNSSESGPPVNSGLQLSASPKAPQLHLTASFGAPAESSGGRAASYDIRISTSAMTNQTSFLAARQVTAINTAAGSLPIPAATGTQQSVEIIGLTPNKTYYVAFEAIDAAGNRSSISNLPSQATAKYEGYGYATTGGGDNLICRVTSLSDSGAGSLRGCIDTTRSCETQPLTIIFDVAGSITLTSDIILNSTDCRLTIDGSTAPSPGVTIKKPECPPNTNSCPVGGGCIANGEFLIGTDDNKATHDIIVTYLRFQGNYAYHWGDCLDNDSATLGLQYNFSNIVLDHLTIRNSEDAGPDMWTGTRDSHSVTLSNTILAWSNHPLLLKGDGETGELGSRKDISMHHNVIARSGQRMPAIVSQSYDVDFRNNIIFDWDAEWTLRPSGDGMQILPQGIYKPTLNIINNQFLPGTSPHPSLGLFYGDQDGPDSADGGPSGCPAQGTVISNSNMGEMYVAGNVLPSTNCDRWSTVSAERAVLPVDAKVTTDGASALETTVLPGVGTHFRTADESSLISEIANAIAR